MTRYVLHPGYVVSHTDGDRHYIGAGRLAELYGLPRNARTVIVADWRMGFREQDGDVHLYPRLDGDYKLPFTPSRDKT